MLLTLPQRKEVHMFSPVIDPQHRLILQILSVKKLTATSHLVSRETEEIQKTTDMRKFREIIMAFSDEGCVHMSL